MDKTNKVPEGLQHHPIVGVDNYSVYDGLYKNYTDAKALSVGIAQWNYEDEDGIKEISAKVFRRNDKRWSRQSEELPLHRCFDLSILIVQALQQSTQNKFIETGDYSFKPRIVNDKELILIKRFYDKYKDDLTKKMETLKDLLEAFLS